MKRIRLGFIKHTYSSQAAIGALEVNGVVREQAKEAVACMIKGIRSFIVTTNDKWVADLNEFFDFEFVDKYYVSLIKVFYPSQKFETIRSLRAATGLELKEAKEVYEAVLGGGTKRIEVNPDVVDDLKKWFDIIYEQYVIKSEELPAVVSPVGSNKDLAIEHLSSYVKELLDDRKMMAAKSVCNLLGILKNVEDYQ
jgi:hypothetical protein